MSFFQKDFCPAIVPSKCQVFASLFLVGSLASTSEGETWCGKHYKPNLSVVNPGGQFPVPAASTEPFLAFRCAPVIRPYVAGDASIDSDDIAVLIDTPIVHSLVWNAVPITIPTDRGLPDLLSVTVFADDIQLAKGQVGLNTTKNALAFSLRDLSPRTRAYNLSCRATYGKQFFTASGSLSYLPYPPFGTSVTKMDLRTGALLARPADGSGGPYAPVFPVGFYTDFGNYLAKNLTIPSKLKSQGFNVIHPIPTFDNLTALDIVLHKIQEAGLYLIYDMRWDYMNSTRVAQQVNRIKSRPNLLLWYTADEPDGWGDPLDATLKAANLIQSLDGGDGNGGAGYHPVSLVLNCQNYYFTQYTRGADVVTQDAYPVGINATYSSVWDTPCTTDYGDCGCDNCNGTFEDISTRMDEISGRLFVNGWERTKAVWTVPQGFGNQSYWSRYPSGQEFIVQSLLAINHGGLGVVSWQDPTTPGIKESASQLALAAPKLAKFILNPRRTFRHIAVQRVDIGLWEVDKNVLVLATNLNYFPKTIKLENINLGGSILWANQVLDSGAKLDILAGHLSFDSVGSGVFILDTI